MATAMAMITTTEARPAASDRGVAPNIKHPPSLGARFVRALGFLTRMRGWRRIAQLIAPPDASHDFVICNDGLWYAGTLGSFIEREVYLFGGYESAAIGAFLDLIPAARRRTMLDVGANIGTHALLFAREFATVHAFEPNPAVFADLQRNAALNGAANLHLHNLGLADRAALLDFHAVPMANAGLGTFSPIEQYDMKLEVIGQARVERGDDYLRDLVAGGVDAVKIDVQGFEPEVLRGLRTILAECRPYIWFEVGEATRRSLGSLDALRAILPFDFRLMRFIERRRGLIRRTELIPVSAFPIGTGDYVAIPLRADPPLSGRRSRS